MQNKDHYYQKYREWCRDNPVQAAAIQERWRDAHPHYYRDYMRLRKATTEPLIFSFLDNGFSGDGDVEGYVSYLRAKGIPEQHIGWFKTDVKNIFRGLE